MHDKNFTKQAREDPCEKWLAEVGEWLSGSAKAAWAWLGCNPPEDDGFSVSWLSARQLRQLSWAFNVLDEDKRKSDEESSAGFDLQAEYARQREHLERNVAQLKRKVLKDEKMYKTDKKRMASEGKLLTETMAKLKAVHAEDLQRREDLAVKAEEQSSDPRLAEIVAGLGERAQMLEELMGEAGLLHPPPLPQ